MQRVSFSLKKLSLYIFLACLCIMSAYVIFIAILSIRIGWSYQQHDGFWMPIAAGFISIFCCLWLLVWFSKSILTKIRQKDLFEF